MMIGYASDVDGARRIGECVFRFPAGRATKKVTIISVFSVSIPARFSSSTGLTSVASASFIITLLTL